MHALYCVLIVIFLIAINGGSAFRMPLAKPQHQSHPVIKTQTLQGVDSGVDLGVANPYVDLASIGNEIEVSAPSNGLSKIVMKFGGSSLANAERITYVAKLIKKHTEQGYKPIIVCSAMGKTTNSLLSSGDFALKGDVYIDSLRTLHISTATSLGLKDTCIAGLNELLDDVEKLLNGVKYIGELSPRTKDTLVSFGERMSVRIMAGEALIHS